MTIGEIILENGILFDIKRSVEYSSEIVKLKETEQFPTVVVPLTETAILDNVVDIFRCTQDPKCNPLTWALGPRKNAPKGRYICTAMLYNSVLLGRGVHKFIKAQVDIEGEPDHKKVVHIGLTNYECSKLWNILSKQLQRYTGKGCTEHLKIAADKLREEENRMSEEYWLNVEMAQEQMTEEFDQNGDPLQYAYPPIQLRTDSYEDS